VLKDCKSHIEGLIRDCLRSNDFLIARRADELLEMVMLQHEHDIDCVAYGLDPSKHGRKKITEKIRDQVQRLWLPRLGFLSFIFGLASLAMSVQA
jgi:hypothetical protein